MTQSAITSPADPFFGFDQQQTQSVTISGTSNGTTGDHVDIDCYTDDGSAGTNKRTLVSDLLVGGDGSFSTSVTLNALGRATDYGECRLRAVPAETSPTTGLSAFAGPRMLVGSLNSRDYTVGSSTNIDFYIMAPQLGAANDYDSFGSCGLSDSYSGSGRVRTEGLGRLLLQRLDRQPRCIIRQLRGRESRSTAIPPTRPPTPVAMASTTPRPGSRR